jgi:hypothetical protein
LFLYTVTVGYSEFTVAFREMGLGFRIYILLFFVVHVLKSIQRVFVTKLEGYSQVQCDFVLPFYRKDYTHFVIDKVYSFRGTLRLAVELVRYIVQCPQSRSASSSLFILLSVVRRFRFTFLNYLLQVSKVTSLVFRVP